MQAALAALAGPADEEAVAARFSRSNKARQQRIAELLETLVSLGKARQLDDGRFLAM